MKLLMSAGILTVILGSSAYGASEETTKLFEETLEALKQTSTKLSELTSKISTLEAENKNLLAKLTKLENAPAPTLHIPSGAVFAFDIPCPEGWRPFEKAAGRFLVAAGTTQDSRGEERTFTLGKPNKAADGEFRHKLTTDEMPSHTHNIPHKGADHRVASIPEGQSLGVTSRIDSEETRITGTDAPHNNIPPYIVLQFCEKL